MTENTKIEWADHTFNPWVGCSKISPACDHCYAESWAKRTGSPELWAGNRRRTSLANWKQPLRWNAAAAAAGVRYRVFCASLADVFDNQVPDEWRADLWKLIRTTPHLDWLLLTKRIGNARQLLPEDWGWGPHRMQDGYPNVWLGATFANQFEYDRDLEKLLVIPARVRFGSFEPLLGHIDLGLKGTLPKDTFPGYQMVHERLHWVIAGGESGPGARPAHASWFRSMRDECAEMGTAFLFKQWGEWIGGRFDRQKCKMICSPSPEHQPVGRIFWTNPGAPAVHLWDEADHYWTNASARVGKTAAGRLLDGVEHNSFPA